MATIGALVGILPGAMKDLEGPMGAKASFTTCA